MRTQVMLSSLLMIFLGSGCQQPDQIVFVPQQCHVKIVEDPQIEDCRVDDKFNMENLKDVKNAWAQDATCTRRNYLREKEARIKQQNEAKVCQ